MTLATEKVDSRISFLLKDPTHTRWTLPERLLWMVDALREIATFKRSALAKTVVIALAPGTRQALPADVTLLLYALRNTSADGLTPGRAVTRVAREFMNLQSPTWHTASASATVENVMYEDESPRIFYVFPPQPATGTGAIEVVCAASPDDVAGGEPLPIDPSWLPVIVNYCLFRAYSKDSEDAGNANLAIAYRQAFDNAIGARTGAKQAVEAARGT